MATVRNRLIGTALRCYRMREDLGMSLDDAGSIAGCDRSKISRIETGERRARPEDLRKLLAEYGAHPDAAALLIALASRNRWWDSPMSYLPPGYADLFSLATVATRISSVDVLELPFLAQHPGRTRAAADADPSLDPLAREDLCRAVPDMQRAVLRGKAVIRLLIGEPALAPTVAGGMLVSPGVLPRAEVRVLPFATGSWAAPWAGTMTLLEFAHVPGTDGVVHLGGPNGGVFLDHGPGVGAARRALDRLADQARILSPAAEPER